LPTAYPLEFYVTNPSNGPITTVEGDEAHDNWTFILMSVEQIKEVIYNAQKKIRDKMQAEPFNSNGSIITLRNEDDVRNIKLINVSDNKFKIGKGLWVRTPSKLAQLKTDTDNHVKTSEDWEESGNALVDDMTTRDELKIYYQAM